MSADDVVRAPVPEHQTGRGEHPDPSVGVMKQTEHSGSTFALGHHWRGAQKSKFDFRLLLGEHTLSEL